MRTRAERRNTDWKKAIRKKNIAKHIYLMEDEFPYYDNLHQYSKNKIHCSCPLCAAKTNSRKIGRVYEGFHRTGKYNYKISELKKYESSKSDLNEYLEQSKEFSDYYNSICEDLEMKVLHESMETKYNEYLKDHIGGVQKGYKWLKEHDLLDKNKIKKEEEFWGSLDKIIKNHDKSKYDYEEEYYPYMHYFYGKQTQQVKNDFDLAWLRHQHLNMHHWQHWMLQNDEDGLKLMDMPYVFIVEMICDWWAFSWNKNDLKEIFNWYNSHKKGIMISDNTRKSVEKLLDDIKEELDKE